MLQDQNESASRRSLNVMIELYKRRIWNDEKTVNVIAEAVYNSNAKIVEGNAKISKASKTINNFTNII